MCLFCLTDMLLGCFAVALKMKGIPVSQPVSSGDFSALPILLHRRAPTDTYWQSVGIAGKATGPIPVVQPHSTLRTKGW